MRVPLSELAPKWLATGPGRERMGLSWECFCGRHRLECWLWNPMDRQGPITVQPGLSMRNRDGEDFSNLSLDWYFRCGEDLVFVAEGCAIQG